MNNIALTFKTTCGWEFVQFVPRKDGRQFAIKGQTGAGYAISPSYYVEVKKKGELTDILNEATHRGYILKDNYTDRLELQSYQDLV